MSEDASHSNGFVAVLTIAGAVIGAVGGSLTVMWTMADRVEKEVENRVRYECQVTALEQRVKALEGSVWKIETAQ